MNFSVVIPAFGWQRMLNRTIATLKAQTLPPSEIIVVDDGSQKPLKVPRGVRLIRIERKSEYRGSSAAKNAGARIAYGDWLVFSDDDIEHAPEALESIAAKLSALNRNDVLVNIFSICKWETPNLDRMASVFHDRSVFSEQHCGVIRKDYFNSIGRYDEGHFLGWGYNNQDLSLRVVRRGGIVTSNVRRIGTNELLTCYHCRPSNHDASQAKSDFLAKYGEPFHIGMLVRSQSVSKG